MKHCNRIHCLTTSGSFSSRGGMSLLELLAVITLMGIFAATVGMRYGRDILGDTGVRSKARELTIGLNAAQRAAIRTGLSHGIRFDGSSNDVTSWTVIRLDSDGGTSVVDGPYPMEADYELAVDRTEIVFDFQGNGTGEFNAQFTGPNRKWMVSVMPLTRMIDSREVQ